MFLFLGKITHFLKKLNLFKVLIIRSVCVFENLNYAMIS